MTAWEQQPEESSAAFGAFVLFRDLGSKRSLDEAARRYHGSPESAPNPSPEGKRKGASGHIRDSAEKYRWHERARARDEERDCESRVGGG